MHMVNTQPRWVEFSGIDNVRDLGGLPVSDGHRTRFGRVYRASTPQELTEADLGMLLGSIGVKTIIDLRLPDEVRREGYGLLADSSVQRINLPVHKVNARPGDIVPDSREVDLVQLYGELLAGSAESVVTAARMVADAERHAVVFHCAAGKDRTGVLAAVLLDAIGVPPEVIAHDYALSGERLAQVRERLVKLASYPGLPSARKGVLAADPQVMSEFLENLHAEFGGAARWLLHHGLSEAELARLRETLVEPVAA